jgi:integrase
MPPRAWGEARLVMTTGIRRGEVCALRWARVDLDEGVIEIRSSYMLRRGEGKEKDTKTHQMRRIALDTETIVLLREHKDRCRLRLAKLGIEFHDDMYVFSGVHDFDPRTPYSPHAVSSRYKDMAERLGIDTHIHALRHYSATKLLTAGIDLRTAASATAGEERQPFGSRRRGSPRPTARPPRSSARKCRSAYRGARS